MTDPRGRKPHVVDTNVVVVANHKHGESYSCANACSQALLFIKKSGRLVIDQSGMILGEYFRYCSPFGQRGVGDSFVRWIHDNRRKPDLVETIAVRPKAAAPDDYEEFPNHEGLSEFDPSDRVFVAVANAHPERPAILEATDSKWLDWKDALKECGITVKFLCPKEIEEAYRRKCGE